MQNKLIKTLVLISIFLCFGSIFCQTDTTDKLLEEMLNMTVSTAAKYEQNVSEAPSSVEIITSEDIDRYGYQTLADVLQSVKGFFIRDDHSYQYVGSRGFDRPSSYSNKLLLMVNGHIINENYYGSIFIGNDLGIDLKNVEKIEIVVGPGSVLYGTGAMLAVINIITKAGNNIDGFKFNYQTGNYGRNEGTFLFGKEFSNKLSVTASAKGGIIAGRDYYFKEFDTDSTNFGNAINSDADRYYQLFSSIKYTDFTANISFVSREKTIPTAPWEVTFNSNNTKSTDDRGYMDFNYKFDLNKNQKLKLRTYFDYYRSDGFYQYNAPQTEQTKGIWVGAEVQHIWDIFPGNRLTWGIEEKYNSLSLYRFWINDSSVYDHNQPFNILSFYLQDQYQILDNLSITAGLRYENNSLFFQGLTPRAALVFNPYGESYFKLIYGKAFRSPNNYEAFYTDYLTQKPNHNLKPEQISTTELCYEQKFLQNFYFKASVFYYVMNDLIDQYLDPSDSLTQFTNKQNIESFGFEADLKAKFKSGLWGYLSFTHSFARDKFDSKHLSNSPVYLVKAGLSQKFFKHFSVSLDYLYESERNTFFEDITPSFMIFNLYFDIKPNLTADNTFNSILNRFSLSLKINNLLDKQYYLPGGYEHIQHSLIQNGRNFIINFGLAL